MNKLNHIAFIMDGNGRWGRLRGKSRNYGHLNGVKTVKKIVEASLKLRIPQITFYVFSTENWKRPKIEINYLFKLISVYFSEEIKNVVRNGIKIKILGNIEKLNNSMRKILKSTEIRTKKNKKIQVNLAINYGSRSEIAESFKILIKKKNNINLNDISKNLYTDKIPDPDILIRTGGHKRLSNFLLWQLAYTEIYFIKKLWPDFNKSDLKKIIKDYQNIKRNFGGI